MAEGVAGVGGQGLGCRGHHLVRGRHVLVLLGARVLVRSRGLLLRSEGCFVRGVRPRGRGIRRLVRRRDSLLRRGRLLLRGGERRAQRLQRLVF